MACEEVLHDCFDRCNQDVLVITLDVFFDVRQRRVDKSKVDVLQDVLYMRLFT